MTDNLAIAEAIIAAQKAFAKKQKHPERKEFSVLLCDIQERCIEAANAGNDQIQMRKELTEAELDFIAHRGYIVLMYLGLTDDYEEFNRYFFEVQLPATNTGEWRELPQ